MTSFVGLNWAEVDDGGSYRQQHSISQAIDKLPNTFNFGFMGTACVCVCLLRDKTQNFGIQKDAELRFKTIVRLLILLPPARSRFR